jgi:hypothetical protein
VPDEPRNSSGAAGLVAEAGVSAVLGVVVGAVAAFQALRTVNGIWVGVLVGVLAAACLSFGLARWWRSPLAPGGATLGWFFTVFYLASGRAEGDVVVPGSARGYSFVFIPVLALALGIRHGAVLQRRYTSGDGEPKTSL